MLDAYLRANEYMRVERPSDLWEAGHAAGVVYAYSHRLDGEGSITVYLRRLNP